MQNKETHFEYDFYVQYRLENKKCLRETKKNCFTLGVGKFTDCCDILTVDPTPYPLYLKAVMYGMYGI